MAVRTAAEEGDIFPTQLRFIRGAGSYVDDLRLEEMMHLKVVRSIHARARLLKVEGGINGKELSADLAAVGEGSWGGRTASLVPYPALPTRYVSYVGQPVAAVVSDDPYKAEDAMDEVQVEYEPLRALVDPEEAMSFEPIHPDAKSNVANTVELGSPFDEKAPVVLEDELRNARIIPNPMEPRGLVARYEGSKLTVWASTQSVHSWKSGICGALKLPREAVRVIEMDTGGAFGCKSALYPEYVIACYAAMKMGRPVKWVESRTEHLQATSQGRGARGRMKVYAEGSGRVLGIKADVLIDSGAYAIGVGAMAGRFMAWQLTGPYAIKAALARATSVYTNKVPLGPYRGQGRPEAAFFVERMMDLLADELKMDPVELRLKNASPTPSFSPLGLKLGAFESFLRTAVEAVGYPGRRKDGHYGFSSYVLVSAAQPGESSRVQVKDGIVRVWVGGSQGGQDYETVAKVVLSEELGVPQSAVELVHGDTDELDQGIGTWASRSAIVLTDALSEAAGRIKEQVRSAVGTYSSEELLKQEFDVTVFHREEEQANSFGACLVRASIDEAGAARAEECVSYHDVGRPINPSMVESQVIGGVVQGVGQVLYEEAMYDSEGQPLVGSFGDAGLVTAELVPTMTVKMAASEGAQVKGVAEAPTVGTPPALVRALESALGRRLRKTPLEPEELR